MKTILTTILMALLARRTVMADDFDERFRNAKGWICTENLHEAVEIDDLRNAVYMISLPKEGLYFGLMTM